MMCLVKQTRIGSSGKGPKVYRWPCSSCSLFSFSATLSVLSAAVVFQKKEIHPLPRSAAPPSEGIYYKLHLPCFTLPQSWQTHLDRWMIPAGFRFCRQRSVWWLRTCCSSARGRISFFMSSVSFLDDRTSRKSCKIIWVRFKLMWPLRLNQVYPALRWFRI